VHLHERRWNSRQAGRHPLYAYNFFRKRTGVDKYMFALLKQNENHVFIPYGTLNSIPAQVYEMPPLSERQV